MKKPAHHLIAEGHVIGNVAFLDGLAEPKLPQTPFSGNNQLPIKMVNKLMRKFQYEIPAQGRADEDIAVVHLPNITL